MLNSKAMNNLIKVEGFIYRAAFKTEDEVVKWLNLYEEESGTS